MDQGAKKKEKKNCHDKKKQEPMGSGSTKTQFTFS